MFLSIWFHSTTLQFLEAFVGISLTKIVSDVLINLIFPDANPNAVNDCWLFKQLINGNSVLIWTNFGIGFISYILKSDPATKHFLSIISRLL